MEFTNENLTIVLPITILFVVLVLYNFIFNKYLHTKFGDRKMNLARIIVFSFVFGFFVSNYLNHYEDKNMLYHISMIVVSLGLLTGLYFRAKDVLKH